MHTKHQKTLQRIFAKPTPHMQIEWRKIEAMLVACGAQILEGDGSAVRIVLGARRVYMHRPHPHKEAKAYQVKAIRELLEAEGIRP